MVTELTVVNDCLAIMGEAPLNSLAEEHAFKTAALNTLERVSNTVQSSGWWYNMEEPTLTVNPTDMRVYLPNDVGTILPDRTNTDVVQRGMVLYDLKRGTDQFPVGYTCTMRLVRKLAISDVPESVAFLVAAITLLEFQTLYDGDQTKTRNLADVVARLRSMAMAEHIRNRRVNLVDTNVRLQRVRRHIY